MHAVERIKRPELVGLAWLVARLWLGLEFLRAGWSKVFGAEQAFWVGDQAGVAVGGFLGHAVELAPGGQFAGQHPQVTSWYAEVIQRAFLPNAELFSYLVAFGEVLVGLALVLGIATRFAAAMGLPMNFSYLLAGSNGIGPLMLLVELPILLVGAMAGYYGVDPYLLPYLRGHLHVPTWRPTPSPELRPS